MNVVPDAPPAYVAFEGIDGCGKTTQAKLLAEALGAVLTKENGGTPVGRAIREITHGEHVMNPLTEAYLFAADRAEHLSAVVLPALLSGRHVVSDRCIYSSLAYQGAGRELGEIVSDINRAAMEPRGHEQRQRNFHRPLYPDAVIYLRVPLQVALARKGNTDRIENESFAFFRRVFNYFEDRCLDHSPYWYAVDGTGTVDEVAERVKQALR